MGPTVCISSTRDRLKIGLKSKISANVPEFLRQKHVHLPRAKVIKDSAPTLRFASPKFVRSNMPWRVTISSMKSLAKAKGRKGISFFRQAQEIKLMLMARRKPLMVKAEDSYLDGQGRSMDALERFRSGSKCITKWELVGRRTLEDATWT
ncbi:hypothetical protein B0H34DRAFT_528675 [Crassisporium funariophilum]|nr:hypothetical protein B0H34DRAFT_528675 [Crassisporium funariophilum]